MKPLLWKTKYRLGKIAENAVQALSGQVEGEIAGGGIERGNRSPGFHRKRRDPIVVERQLDHMGRVRNRRPDCVGIAFREPEGAVARCLRPNHRPIVLLGGRRVGHDRKACIIDADQFGRFDSAVQGFGHDQRHRLTHIPDPVHCKSVVGGNGNRPLGRGHHAARHRTQPVGHEVGARPNTEDARNVRRRSDVDPLDLRMGVVGAHDLGIHLPWYALIVREAPPAGQKPLIFQTGSCLEVG